MLKTDKLHAQRWHSFIVHFVMSNWLKLLICILVPVAGGAAIGYIQNNEISAWYPTIVKPTWNPPNYIFAPVWTTLYVLMGIAMFLVWKQYQPAVNKTGAALLWIVQLAFNFAWSIIFFKLHRIGLAMAEISLLWVFILLTILAFARINKAAAWLLVPYISWVSFAAMLNYSIWQLN